MSFVTVGYDMNGSGIVDELYDYSGNYISGKRERERERKKENKIRFRKCIASLLTIQPLS